MKKLFILTALTCASLSLGAVEQKIGVVNFKTCIVDSKLGKQEQNALETLLKQFATLIEDKDKQRREISDKLQDKDYLDGLSKEAEESMRNQLNQLIEELDRYQQQYYQAMSQGQNKMFQTVVGGINQVAEHIASSKGYNMILSKDACFFSSPSLDITADIVKAMDKQFDEDAKKQEEAKKEAALAQKPSTIPFKTETAPEEKAKK